MAKAIKTALVVFVVLWAMGLATVLVWHVVRPPHHWDCATADATMQAQLQKTTGVVDQGLYHRAYTYFTNHCPPSDLHP
jgi:uncharacterized membrane protein